MKKIFFYSYIIMIYLQNTENTKETGDIFQQNIIKSLLPTKNNVKSTNVDLTVNEEGGKSHEKSTKFTQDLKHFQEINKIQASKILNLMNTLQSLQNENYQLYLENFKKESEYQAVKKEIELLLNENKTLILKNKELIQQIMSYIKENQQLLLVAQNLKDQLHLLQTEAQQNAEETQKIIQSLEDQIVFVNNKIKNLQEYIITLSDILEAQN